MSRPTSNDTETGERTDAVTTSLCNLRDVGGLPLVDGGAVRDGVLYRGDAPMVGDQDPDLQPWPPGSVIDLRAPEERAILDTSLYWPPSVPVLEVSLLGAANPSNWDDDEQSYGLDVLEPMYRSMAERADLLVSIASAAATGPTPVFVHCAGGKDRTAVAIALLLEVAGVETEAIISDQLRSNDAVDDLRVRFERAFGRECATPVPKTIGEALLAALQVWQAHPGGAAAWLVQHGMAPVEVEALRIRLRG
jgi:protein-tyrosine phosphatase